MTVIEVLDGLIKGINVALVRVRLHPQPARSPN